MPGPSWPASWRLTRRTSWGQKSAAGVARHRPGERETIGSVGARALTEDSVEVEFLTDDPVAQAVTCQRVTFDAGTTLRPLCLR